MAVFSVETITAKGLALIAKGQLGVEINFTRMQIGRGQLSGQDPEQLTALIDPIAYFAINSMARNGVTVQVRGIFENSALVAPVHACELGVFAMDPDEGEILYAYSNAGTQGDNIPAYVSGPYSKMYKLNVAIGNAEDVTVDVPAGAYIPEADKGVAGGVAPLDSGGLVPVANIPNIPVTKIPSGIDASKIGDGSVSNTEFQALDGVTGPIQTQLNSKSSASDYVRQPGYGTTAGSANAYTLTLSPALTTYVAGVCVAVNIHAANTGASTINVNGLGAKSILDSKGAALTSGKLRTGSVYTLRYNGTSFILQGEGGEYGTATAPQVLSGYTFGTDVGLVAGTMPNRSGSDLAATGSVAATGKLNLRVPIGYWNGVNYVYLEDPNFIAANIAEAINLFGMQGALKRGGLLLSAPTLRQTSSTSFVTLKKMTVGYVGIVRTSFSLSSTSNVPGYAQIYKNGVAVGTLRSATNSLTFVEDFNCSIGDIFELKVRTDATYYQASISNFEIRSYIVSPYNGTIDQD